ncbi:hypothetical protein J6590_002320 [Homalodisca vitripennis]|nr:hypothetical protein J6590_002320 [Homalodisca vitripennis]
MNRHAKYRCDQCARGYRWPETLRRHKRYECGKEPMFPCPVSDSRRAALESQMLRYSGGGGGNVCDACGRVYRWSTGLSRHKRLECGKEARCQCPFCDYRAKQKVNLFAHIRRKHGHQYQYHAKHLQITPPLIKFTEQRSFTALREQLEIKVYPSVPK